MPTVLKRMMTFILLLPLLLALSLDVKAQRSRRPEPKPLSDDEKVQVVGDLVGWEPFTKVFTEYRGLADDQRPRTDDQKRDQWLIRFSKAVERDLGPFFQAWGVPVSDSAREAVADLPGWMPVDLPATSSPGE